MNIILPKVTVVTVTYNAEKFLEETIESVIEQDYPNIEYIIIDGGSTDGTVDIIKKYEEHITYWISEKDKGIYDAMNKGIIASAGEWINFMNAGDIFSNKYVLSNIALHIDQNIDVIYGGVTTVSDVKNIYYAPKNIDTCKEGMPCCHQSMFARTSLAKIYMYNTNYKLSSDVEYFMQFYINGAQFKIVNQSVCDFLMGGVSQTDTIRGHSEVLSIIRPYLNNPSDIFKNSSYIALRNLDENPNIYFATLVNRFIQEIVNFEESSLALYGDGNITKLMIPFLEDRVKVIFDKSIDHKFDGKIIKDNPKNIKMYDFEKLIITVMGREEEIVRYLVDDLKIPRNLIVMFDLSSKGHK